MTAKRPPAAPGFTRNELWEIGQAVAHAEPRAIGRWMWRPMRVHVDTSQGKVRLGEPQRPRAAIELGRDGLTRYMFVLHDTARMPDTHGTGDIERGTRVNPDLILGFTLLRPKERKPGRPIWPMPVRWEYGTPFAITSGTFGVWKPGFDPGKHRTRRWAITNHDDDTLAYVIPAARGPLHWVQGFDAKDQAVCALFGPGLTPGLFANGAERINRPSKTPAAAAPAEAAGEDVAATAAELAALAEAIAGRSTRRFSRRFRIDWERTPIRPARRAIEVGDPGGAKFAVPVRAAKPVSTFVLGDETTDREGLGQTVLGIRIGEGKPVHWKPHRTIGVDSGHFGAWSPGFPTDEIAGEGTFERGALAARVVHAADGDGAYPSLLGLDARRQPVCFLMGDGLVTDVFARARPPGR